MSEPSAAGRLHPASILFRLIPHVRALLIPGLAVLFFSSGDRWQVWIMVMFVPSTLYELSQYLTLRYQLRPTELVIRSGILWRRDRRIPVERIHSIDLTQGPLHRLCRVADVRIETAGGSEPEAVLRVLSLTAFETLRSSIATLARPATHAGDTEPGPPSTPPENTILRLNPADLVRLGIISMRGGAIVAVLIGAAWELNLPRRLHISERISTLSASLTDGGFALAAALILLGIPALIITLSIAWTLLRLYDFHLTERNGDLRISCGLTTRLHATIPRHRIQLLSALSSPIHRAFRRVSVRAETAGGSAEHEQKKVIGQKWFVPLLPQRDLRDVLLRVTARVDLDTLQWRPLSPRAFRRAAKPALLIALVPAAILTIMLPPWGALSLLLFVPLALLLAHANLRRTSYALFDQGVAFRSGVVTRHTSITFFDKIQILSLDESPFDRRRRMATVDVDTAGAGAAGHRVRIPYLDREVAHDLYQTLALRVRHTRENPSNAKPFHNSR